MALNQLQYLSLSMSVIKYDDIRQRLLGSMKDEDISPFTAVDKYAHINPSYPTSILLYVAKPFWMLYLVCSIRGAIIYNPCYIFYMSWLVLSYAVRVFFIILTPLLAEKLILWLQFFTTGRHSICSFVGGILSSNFP